ncbi:tRNA (adenosine(37)-N6)-threonylcarbamoyltransferase complex ATPase subunit type 1 TsaE [Longitalea arenae]|uniref:tRNA (adenosine(37)-N6)-threonylcarbamoyltransferase complex ATPase subunit type 1 TsaE n=1 Tax=Longitalea arenae TaxID=2812558 RepID=UPI0019683C9F|nr:tRNA (adenosine(37)-N6)-threonylcarbamoyltransferase complex ATPase subunit type 1 TsaE [Longitalea arenae]
MQLQSTLDTIRQTARRFWELVDGRKVIAFYGDMGAGKTTLIHALCDEKGVTSTVGSPTFSIINEYRYPGGRLYHIDLYRLKDEEEAVRAGVEDCLYSGDICLVEWPGRAEAILPDNTARVAIEVVDKDTRNITILENERQDKS